MACWGHCNLGFEDSKFPPEKTIYLSLLKENGISPLRDNSLDVVTIDRNSSFSKLWSASLDFLESAKIEQLKISELAELSSDDLASKADLSEVMSWVSLWIVD